MPWVFCESSHHSQVPETAPPPAPMQRLGGFFQAKWVDVCRRVKYEESALNDASSKKIEVYASEKVVI